MVTDFSWTTILWKSQLPVDPKKAGNIDINNNRIKKDGDWEIPICFANSGEFRKALQNAGLIRRSQNTMGACSIQPPLIERGEE